MAYQPLTVIKSLILYIDLDFKWIVVGDLFAYS